MSTHDPHDAHAAAAPRPAEPPPQLRPAMVVLLLLLLGGAGAIVSALRPPAPPPEPPPIVETVPEFSFTERSGRKVTRADLLGKAWVLDCIFTRCGGPCPSMTEKMGLLHASMKPEDRAACVTITVDPGFDTPEVLRAYADRHGASPDRWLFLNGSRKETFEFIAKGMHLAMAEDESDLNHSSRFLLVDRKGRVRGYYRNEPEEFTKLRRDLRAVIAEAP